MIEGIGRSAAKNATYDPGTEILLCQAAEITLSAQKGGGFNAARAWRTIGAMQLGVARKGCLQERMAGKRRPLRYPGILAGVAEGVAKVGLTFMQ